MQYYPSCRCLEISSNSCSKHCSFYLQVPLTLLLEGASNDTQLADGAASTAPTDGSQQTSAKQASAKQPLCRAAQPVILYCTLFLACLLLLSDIQLRHYSEHYKTSCVKLVSPSPVLQHSRPVGAHAPIHWTRHVYGYMFWVRQSPAQVCTYASLKHTFSTS